MSCYGFSDIIMHSHISLVVVAAAFFFPFSSILVDILHNFQLNSIFVLAARGCGFGGNSHNTIVILALISVVIHLVVYFI